MDNEKWTMRNIVVQVVTVVFVRESGDFDVFTRCLAIIILSYQKMFAYFL